MLRGIHCIPFLIQCPYTQDFHAPGEPLVACLSPFRKADNTELSEIQEFPSTLWNKKMIAGNTHYIFSVQKHRSFGNGVGNGCRTLTLAVFLSEMS